MSQKHERNEKRRVRGEKTGFGAEINGLQPSYVFKWNCLLPFLFFYFTISATFYGERDVKMGHAILAPGHRT